MIKNIENEDLIEKLREFISELVSFVDSTSFRRSSLSESDINVNQKDFSTKFKEYEAQISKLTAALEEHTKKSAHYESKCEATFNENKGLKEEIVHLTMLLSEVKDDHFQQLRDKELSLKAKHASEKSDLENTISNLKTQISDLNDANAENGNLLKSAEQKIKEQAAMISRLVEENVPKRQYEDLITEKLNLDKKILQLENSLITETSQLETYKQQLGKLRSNLEEAYQEKAFLKKEIEDLEYKLKQQIAINKENMDRSQLRYSNTDQISFSYKFPHVEESQLNALAYNAGHSDFNLELLSKFEHLQNKFESQRLESQKEAESLKRQNTDLQAELFKIKSFNQLILDEKQIMQKSIRDIGSKEFSGVKKSNDISDELVEKIVRVEQHNKKLRTDVKVLNHLVNKATESNCQHQSILYSAILAYLGSQ